MNIDKMNIQKLKEALCAPSCFESEEEHIAAFKRYKNLRAK